MRRCNRNSKGTGLHIIMKLIKYIKEKEISTSQISKDTGIWEKKLTDENVTFTASEFLELCSYLHLKPEDLR